MGIRCKPCCTRNRRERNHSLGSRPDLRDAPQQPEDLFGRSRDLRDAPRQPGQKLIAAKTPPHPQSQPASRVTAGRSQHRTNTTPKQIYTTNHNRRSDNSCPSRSRDLHDAPTMTTDTRHITSPLIAATAPVSAKRNYAAALPSDNNCFSRAKAHRAHER
jgi:hypothetical protein